jgi:hypothetical protein
MSNHNALEVDLGLSSDVKVITLPLISYRKYCNPYSGNEV